MAEKTKKKIRGKKKKSEQPSSVIPESDAVPKSVFSPDPLGAPDESEPCDPEEFAEYRKAMLKLNEEYATVMLGSDCLVLNEYWDPLGMRTDVRFLTFETFCKKTMKNKCVNPWRSGSQKKYKSAGSMWLSSGFARRRDTVVFDPSDKVDRTRYYNMFQGFAFKPEKGDWSILRDHIKNIVCAGDSRVYHYVMSWIARIFQDPGGPRPSTALVFRGVQGCGKSCVANAIGKILFPHYKELLHLSHLTGKFNLHLKDALLVFCDEITWGGSRDIEGVLKGIISGPTVRIEPKNKDSGEIQSHMNLIIASNNEWVVPTGLYERRFCVLDVLPDKKDDKDYFRDMFLQLSSGGYAAMLHDFLEYPRMSTKDLCTVPRTSGLLEQIVNSLSPVHKFWFQRLCDGTILLSDTFWTEDVKCYSFYNFFLDFCETIGRKNFNIIRNQFSRYLKEVCPGMVTMKRGPQDNRENYYVFPSLKQCRDDFQKIVRLNIPWDDAEDFSF